jgi:hypothetical protein
MLYDSHLALFRNHVTIRIRRLLVVNVVSTCKQHDLNFWPTKAGVNNSEGTGFTTAMHKTTIALSHMHRIYLGKRYISSSTYPRGPV